MGGSGRRAAGVVRWALQIMYGKTTLRVLGDPVRRRTLDRKSWYRRLAVEHPQAAPGVGERPPRARPLAGV